MSSIFGRGSALGSRVWSRRPPNSMSCPQPPCPPPPRPKANASPVSASARAPAPRMVFVMSALPAVVVVIAVALGAVAGVGVVVLGLHFGAHARYVVRRERRRPGRCPVGRGRHGPADGGRQAERAGGKDALPRIRHGFLSFSPCCSI